MKKSKKDHPAPKRTRGQKKHSRSAPARSPARQRSKTGTNEQSGRHSARDNQKESHPPSRGRARQTSSNEEEDDEIYQDRFARRKFSEREENFERKDRPDYWDKSDYPEHIHTNDQDINDRHKNHGEYWRDNERSDAGIRKQEYGSERMDYYERNNGSGRNRPKEFEPFNKQDWTGKHPGRPSEIPRNKY